MFGTYVLALDSQMQIVPASELILLFLRSLLVWLLCLYLDCNVIYSKLASDCVISLRQYFLLLVLVRIV